MIVFWSRGAALMHGLYEQPRLHCTNVRNSRGFIVPFVPRLPCRRHPSADIPRSDSCSVVLPSPSAVMPCRDDLYVGYMLHLQTKHCSKADLILRLTIPVNAIVYNDRSFTFLANLRVGSEAEPANRVASASRRHRRASRYMLYGANQALIYAIVPAPIKLISMAILPRQPPQDACRTNAVPHVRPMWG
jgi:hypothetical protein